MQILLNPLPRVKKKSISIDKSDNVWTGESGYFQIRAINQYGDTRCGSIFSMAHARKTFYRRGALGIRLNPDTTGSVWTGEFDFNTLHVDKEILESGKKKLRVQKYPDTCGWGPGTRKSTDFSLLG